MRSAPLWMGAMLVFGALLMLDGHYVRGFLLLGAVIAWERGAWRSAARGWADLRLRRSGHDACVREVQPFAFAEGRRDRAAGLPITACPYLNTPAPIRAAEAWYAGYEDARINPWRPTS